MQKKKKQDEEEDKKVVVPPVNRHLLPAANFKALIQDVLRRSICPAPTGAVGEAETGEPPEEPGAIRPETHVGTTCVRCSRPSAASTAGVSAPGIWAAFRALSCSRLTFSSS